MQKKCGKQGRNCFTIFAGILVCAFWNCENPHLQWLCLMDFKVDLKQLRSSHVGTFVLTSIDTFNSNKCVYLSLKPHRDTLVNEFWVFSHPLEPILTWKLNWIYWNNILYNCFSYLSIFHQLNRGKMSQKMSHKIRTSMLLHQIQSYLNFCRYMTALKSQFYDSNLLFKY